MFGDGLGSIDRAAFSARPLPGVQEFSVLSGARSLLFIRHWVVLYFWACMDEHILDIEDVVAGNRSLSVAEQEHLAACEACSLAAFLEQYAQGRFLPGLRLRAPADGFPPFEQ